MSALRARAGSHDVAHALRVQNLEVNEMKHRVIRQFPGCAVETGQVIDTTSAPARNIASLVERRFLEPVLEPAPATLPQQQTGGQQQQGALRGAGNRPGGR